MPPLLYPAARSCMLIVAPHLLCYKHRVKESWSYLMGAALLRSCGVVYDLQDAESSSLPIKSWNECPPLQTHESHSCRRLTWRRFFTLSGLLFAVAMAILKPLSCRNSTWGQWSQMAKPGRAKNHVNPPCMESNKKLNGTDWLKIGFRLQIVK